MIYCTMPQCQTTAGCVCGLATAKVGESIPVLDATYVCEVPQSLGRVTKLTVKSGKVTAQTESGIEMILPTERR